MKIGDMVRLGPDYPDRVGIITKILTENEHGPLEVEVMIKARPKWWEDKMLNGAAVVRVRQ